MKMQMTVSEFLEWVQNTTGKTYYVEKATVEPGLAIVGEKDGFAKWAGTGEIRISAVFRKQGVSELRKVAT